MLGVRATPSQGGSDPAAAQGVGAIRFAARAGSILAALFCLAIGYWTWVDTRSDFTVSYTPMVELGASATDGYFRGMERSLQHFGNELMSSPADLRSARTRAEIARFLREHPDLAALSLIEADGAVVASSDAVDAIPQENVAHAITPSTEGFSRVIPEGGMTIGRPYHAPHLAQWIIPLRVAMRGKDGVAHYVLSAALPLSKPYGLWKDAPLPEGAALGLLRDDGYLATQYPIPERKDLDELFGTPRVGALIRFLREHDFPPMGSLIGFSGALDGESVYIFRRLARYRSTFYMVAPMSLIWNHWLRTMRQLMLVIGLFVLAGWAVYRGTLRRQRLWTMENQRAKDEFERISRMDFLTDALNRRAFYAELEKELSRSRRERQPTALIVLDLDHFKTVNDRHGHLAGDEALQQFVRATRSELRPYDMLGRFGGEEFTVLLPNTSTRDACVIAERIRARLQSHPIGPDGTVVTVSAGVADSLEAEVREDFVRLIGVADERLYHAKRERNAVAAGP